MKEHLLPVRIVASENAENVEALFIAKVKQAPYRYDSEWREGLTKVNGNGYIILDFGAEMHGGVRIITGLVSPRCAEIHIRFGESIGEVNSALGEKNATNHHSQRDFKASIGDFGDVVFGQTGFRFVRIDFADNTRVEIQNIWAVNNIFSQKPVYVYEGKDKRIAEIFEAAKRTVDLCASSGYVWDGVKRDRLVWVGDLHPEMMALEAIYGKVTAVERSLDFARKNAPLPNWMNNIPTYSQWWIITLADYFQATKNEVFASKQLDYIEKLIEQMNTYVEEDGTLIYPKYLVDWPTKGTDDELAGVRAIHIYAMNKAIELLGYFGRNTAIAIGLKEKLLRKPIEIVCKKQVIALKYFALGSISDEEYEKLIVNGSQGFSTFMSYYILTAIASRDEKLAIRLMKEYYGAMIDRGATTFWEDFDMDWLDGTGSIDEITPAGLKDIHGDGGKFCYVGYRHSLCHGWSAGVAKFIKEHC